MAKAQNAIGLDIGSSSIKLVQIKKTRRGLSLENFAMAPLPPDTIEDGLFLNRTAIIEMIRELIELNKIRARDVALSVGGHSIIVKKINLPAMTDAELEESIRWEAAQYIPFDLVDVYLDYQILRVRAEQGQMEVLLVAAKREIVDQYISVVKEADLKPVVIDTDCFAVQNIYEFGYGSKENELVALIHIGAESLNINLLAYGVTTFTRDLRMGTRLYLQEIQKELGISPEDAEAYLTSDGGDRNIIPEEIYLIIKRIGEGIASEIKRSLDFYLATSGEERIDQVYLSGGGAKISPLQDAIINLIGAPLEPLDPFKNLNVDPQLFNLEYLDEVRPLATVALGLSLRMRGDGDRE